MLKRSKAAGLVIRLNLAHLTSSLRILFWKDIFYNHALRIRELDLAEIAKSTSIILFEDLQPSSLSLHTLWLQSHNWIMDPPTFPVAVMQTQRLQPLSITSYKGAWYSLPLSCLTNLKMHNVPERPHLDEFIKTLRGNPHLQTLDMEDSLPSAFEAVGSIVSVNLPRLGSLRLSSTKNPKEVSNILSCIIVPSTAIFEIYCRNKNLAQADQDTLTFIVALDFCLYLSACNFGVQHAKQNMQLTFEPNARQSPQAMLQEIFPALPLLKTKNWTLELETPNTFVKETLCKLSYLRNVTLIGDCTFDFISALMDKPKNYYRQDTAFYSVLFPKLQTLHITTSFGPVVCPIDHLRDCLMECYERKAELKKLTLSDCYGINFEGVHLLKEIVDVEWDGLVMDEEESYEDEAYGLEDYHETHWHACFDMDYDSDPDFLF